MQIIEIEVPAQYDQQRADVVVANVLELSRSKSTLLFDEAKVTCLGKSIKKSDILYVHQKLSVEVPNFNDKLEIEPIAVPDLEILYHDSDIIVINKPAGVAAHPSLGWHGSNVLGGLINLGFVLPKVGPEEQQGIVHRLDVGTSGVMVVALSPHAYTRLKGSFKNREVTKNYQALVQGYLEPQAGTIDAPIGQHKSDQWKFRVVATGRPSVTHYETLEMFRYASLLNIQLETGRTHQIRAHFSALHHPCCGDLTYGADPKLAQYLGLKRQWLHAYKLSFRHPTGGNLIEFQASLPQELSHSLEILRSFE